MFLINCNLKYFPIIQAAVQPMRRKGKGALGARCDFIGSSTNLVRIWEVESTIYPIYETINLKNKFSFLSTTSICLIWKFICGTDNGDFYNPDAVCRKVWVGTIGEPEVDGGTKAWSEGLRAADRWPSWLHSCRYLGMWECGSHYWGWGCSWP